jgi:D-alanyl-D-alanine carboxypeptidase/D-alanyl-D-alanine-endopeptidase (penicillin-binding protein 4)
VGREDSHYRPEWRPEPQSEQPMAGGRDDPSRPSGPPANQSYGRAGVPAPDPSPRPGADAPNHGRATVRPPAGGPIPWATPPGPSGFSPSAGPHRDPRPGWPTTGRATVGSPDDRPAGHGRSYPTPGGYPGQPPTDPPGSGSPAGRDDPEPPAGRSRRRTRLVVGLVTALALVGIGVGVVVVRPGPVATWLGDDRAGTAAAEESAEPPPPPVLAAVGSAAPEPTPAGVRAAIDQLVTGSGLGDLHVAVLDVATGQSLYDHGGAAPTVPASTTKLVTAVAALASRGPGYRIPTRVVAGAKPGEVVLIGGGDPTLAVGGTGSYSGAARLDKLATQVKQALGGTAPTKVIYDTSLFSGPVFEPGWDADIPTGGFGGAITALMTDGARLNPKQATGFAPRTGTPDVAAARSFAKQLGLPDSAVAKGTAPAGSGATAGPSGGGSVAPGAELGRVESPPMIRLVDFMLSASDNIVAEFLARQVALARQKPASFVGAAEAVGAELTELGLSANGLRLADGSGLSRTNRIPPAVLAQALALSGSGKHPELASIVGGLPVAGWSGTLNERFLAKAGTAGGAGVVRAKTGTLDRVHAISGVLTTADGRLLAFAILGDQVPVGPEQAQPKLDRIAAALAGCGCR